MVVVYGTNNCLHCLKVKQLCESFNLDFVYKNVESDIKLRKEFREKYPEVNVVPIVEWNDQVIHGYEEFCQAIENTFNNYGEGKL